MNIEETLGMIKNILELQGKVSKMSVPILWGPPGTGKSDAGELIASMLGVHHIDVRLADKDESVVAGYPYTINSRIPELGKVMKVAVPWWFEEAYDKPCVIVFDEINRASLPVRNAVLQVLCERRLGEYKIPDHVMMVACANQGEEDGTDVDTLDSAHLNRFAHFNWNPSVADWVKWAEGKDINPCVVNYYRVRSSTLYEKSGDDKVKAFATPRTIVALSNLVDKMTGDKRGDYKKVKQVVEQYGEHFIGTSHRAMVKFFIHQYEFSYQEIVNDYKSVRDACKVMESFRHSEFLKEIKALKFFELTKVQAGNICDFVNDLRADEAVGYIQALVKEGQGMTKEQIDNSVNLATLKKKCKKYIDSLVDVRKEVS